MKTERLPDLDLSYSTLVETLGMMVTYTQKRTTAAAATALKTPETRRQSLGLFSPKRRCHVVIHDLCMPLQPSNPNSLRRTLDILKLAPRILTSLEMLHCHSMLLWLHPETACSNLRPPDSTLMCAFTPSSSPRNCLPPLNSRWPP